MNLENFVRYSMTFVASFAIGYASGLVARRFKIRRINKIIKSRYKHD